MKSIFIPAIKLMDQLIFPVKFAIILIIAAIPIVFFGILLLSRIGTDLNFLEREQMGLRYIAQVRSVLQPLQVHRGLNVGYASGELAFGPRMTSTANKVDAALKELQALDQQLGRSLQTSKRFEDVGRAWRQLKAQADRLTATTALNDHNRIVSELLDLKKHVADSSGITLDPIMDSYYLGNALFNQLPRLIDSIGLARARGTAVASKGSFTPESFIELSILSDHIRVFAHQSLVGMGTAMDFNHQLSSTLEGAVREYELGLTQVQTLLKRDLLDADNISVSVEQVFDTSTRSMDQSYALFDAIVPQLMGLFEARISQLQRNGVLYISIIGGVLLLVVYVFTGLYLSLRRSIDSIGKTTERVAGGDLRARLHLPCKDELGVVGLHLNNMIEQFTAVIDKLGNVTLQLASASEQLTSTSKESARSIQDQSQQTETVAAAINQMQATVNEVASNTSQAAQSTVHADQEAAEGLNIFRSASDAFNELASEIQSTSEAISNLENNCESIGVILDVIKAIAEQTNLLALNAAIEAARAGEQGRGFAVVADEVRTLAQKTQESTSEIEQTIGQLQQGADKAVEAMGKSNHRTQEGLALAKQAGEVLQRITEAVAKVTGITSQIAAAAEEQTHVTDEINKNLHHISAIGQQSAAGAEQTAGAAQTLAELSAELQAVVNTFQR